MNEKVLQRLSDSTEQMYNSIMSQLKNGYYAVWHPRIQELNNLMKELVAGYGDCIRGEILETHYQSLLQEREQCLHLEKAVFEQGEIQKMELLQQELPQKITEMKDTLEKSIFEYDMLESEFENVYACEDEFVSNSNSLVEDYKVKLRNRMHQNVDKVSQFQQMTAEERKFFMTHVILFDEGKLESTILNYLTTAEKKVQNRFKAIEQKAIICGKNITFGESREYVHTYRSEQQKEDPGYLSASCKLKEAEAIENKFETWFESLLGDESTVGQLINEKKSDDVISMEKRMIEAIENVVNSNLGGLNMIEMIEAYKEECVALKNSSFKKFFGDYEQIRSLISTLKKTDELFTKWEASGVSMAEIIIG